jgi:hypothetical protein
VLRLAVAFSAEGRPSPNNGYPKSESKLSHSIRFAKFAHPDQLSAGLSTMRAALGVLRLAVAFSAEGRPSPNSGYPKSESKLSHSTRFAKFQH